MKRKSANIIGIAVIALGAFVGDLGAQKADPILIGVSGPLTGPVAQYGLAWRKGFDMALEEVNGSGGIAGRPLRYEFTDTQNDPKQTIATARKYVSDPKILLATGDFSSTSSMAASAIYQRAGLVQFGFNNSNPAFPAGGDYCWSNSPNQISEAPAHAAYVRDLGLKKVAVFQLNTDWGKSTGDATVAALGKFGVAVVLREAYLPDEKDFKAVILKAKAAGIDGIVFVSYANDAALLVRQIREQGVDLPIVANGSNATADFPALAGAAAEGVYVAGDFSADDPRPEVREFVKRWKAKYGEADIDYFSVHAYDSMKLVAAAMRTAAAAKGASGIDRKSVRDAFAAVKDVPSVIYGKVNFNPETRRVDDFLGARLLIRGGKLVSWDGKR
jgi:branched-chain amino acid transport system substrate-binding protein